MNVQRRDFLIAGAVAAAASGVTLAASPAAAQTAASASPGQERGGSVRPGDEAIQYSGGTEVKKLRIINTAELEVEAEKILPKGGYGYIFGGSGAGLGLYLARAIVEAHAGRIWVESPVGTGAAFLFSLPRGD